MSGPQVAPLPVRPSAGARTSDRRAGGTCGQAARSGRDPARCPDSTPTGAVLLAVAGILSLAGCQGKFRDQKPPYFITRADTAHYVLAALESPRPDERRKALNRLAQTHYVTEPAVCKALVLVAKTDRSQCVRAAAVWALHKSVPDAACAAFVAILRSGGEDAGVAPSGAELRAAAAEGLLCFARVGECPADLADEITEIGIHLLRADGSRNVRLAAAELLGFYPRQDVLHELVQALEQRDFGVCHAAERSLMRLTGRTFDHDPRAWREFLAAADDPYSDSGKLDQSLDPPKRTWLARIAGSR